MTDMKTMKLADTLEPMVDTLGMRTVLLELADICHAKADHVRVTWQDDMLANSWDRNGRTLAAVADRLIRTE